MSRTKVRGQGQGQELDIRGRRQGLVNWSSRILDDKDFPRGQQRWCMSLILLLLLLLLPMCVVTARLKRPNTNSDDQLSDSQQQSTPAQKKPRVFFSEHQKAALREAFQRDSYPNQTTLERLASELGVGTKTVVNWFHNHRMRAKQQQVRFNNNYSKHYILYYIILCYITFYFMFL